MDALSVTNLIKTYSNGVSALKGITLTVHEGDFFALLGPNGAGKTTLIGIVAGLVKKTGGAVNVFDIDIDAMPEKARTHIGIVPQEFNFNIFEKVEDIIIHQAGYYGMPRQEAAVRTAQLLKDLGLWEKRREASRTLSGGMKRRLLIARALVHNPKLLLLDEPTAGVDIELRRGMWDFLQTLIAKKITIILTTHYLEEAEQLCNRVAIINRGEIAEQGSMKDLLGTLKMESFVLYLGVPVDRDTLASLKRRHAISLIDETTMEVNVPEKETLSDVLHALHEHRVIITSMRNKSNRLEEVFLHLTKNAPSS